MAEIINWLHFSDLHFGLDNQNWFWPKTKHQLFDDLDRRGEKLGGWDLVIFTGDFTQSGSAEQYKKLNDELIPLWERLSKAGREPQLCAVPGNHDVLRPIKTTAVYRTIMRDWWTEGGIRKEFWQRTDSEYRQAIANTFENYSAWLADLPVPHVEAQRGTLAGDFSATYVKGRSTLGIVGLNSTFLQLAKGDFEGKLDLHISQLNAVCADDPDSWLGQHTASILLTHQPTTWLHPDAQSHFRDNIYTPGRFAAHFFGHLHTPTMMEIAEGGARLRRYHQAPSLFGLENWGDAEPKERMHGYSVGQFSFADGKCEERVWPVWLRQASYGGRKLVPNHEHYDLNSDNYVYSLLSTNQPTTQTSHTIERANTLMGELLPPAADTSAQTHSSDVDGYPRLKATADAPHTFVRLEEQGSFESGLKASRVVVLVASWGVGKDEFLVTCFEKLRGPDGNLELFLLNCEDASEPDAIETVFAQQFGTTLQEFCNTVGTIDGCYLIFDWIHPDLSSGIKFRRLQNIANAILDSCPKLAIAITSRNRPDHSPFPVIEIGPLEEPDARTYLMHNSTASDQIQDPDTVAKLFELSEGLPMHLDRLVKDLRVSSLEAIVEAEAERISEAPIAVPEIPKALTSAVQLLANDLNDQRCFRLLKVLSILPFGETLQTLRHFLPTEPFYPETASRLLESGLIEAIPLQSITPAIHRGSRSMIESTAPKVLKVPRQVRDYVQTLITKDEREELVLAGIDRLFGSNWREGHVRFRILPHEQSGFVASGAGNEFHLIRQISALGKLSDKPLRSDQATQLSIQYARKLLSSSRYRDLTRVAGDLLRVVDRVEEAKSYAQLAALYGEGLRMTGKHAPSVEHLNEALSVGDGVLVNSEKANIWLDICLAERSMGHTELALAAGEQVVKLAGKKNALSLHATVLRASMTLSGAKLDEELRRLERIALREKYTSVASTIALELAKELTNLDEKIKKLDSVIKGRDDQYNISRAIVEKATAIGDIKGYDALSDADLRTLGKSYSYLYSQRVTSIFDACHEALWKALEAHNHVPDLLQLFKYTSFIWRIRGEEQKEADYLKRVDQQLVQNIQASMPQGLILEVHYFWRRVRVLTIGGLVGRGEGNLM
ncbi:MAG TPA: metallophosphoesterase [Tepidisphaeraceae bacterium]|jgi:predicted MPP superfamily phosphohydrolase|nr:metallophosphoesterase [Tepidisphaeraceae bacterium]